jgi:mono/diheme cytochrome c family protein
MRWVPIASLLLMSMFGCGTARLTNHHRPSARLTLRATTLSAAGFDAHALTVVAVVAGATSDEVLVLGRGFEVFRAGALVLKGAADRRWIGGAAIPAPDRNGTWLLALDAEGRLVRVRASGELEPIGARFGAAELVRAVCAAGGTLTVLQLAHALIVSDGESLTRLGAEGLDRINCGGGRVAARRGHEVLVFDLRNRTARRFAIDAVSLALDSRGRLWAATRRALYAERDDGALALRFAAGAGLVHGLTATGTRVWFAVGRELGVVEQDDVRVSLGAAIDPGATLQPALSGDVWVIGDGGLWRYADADTARTPDARWAALIAPVFERACSRCHLPGGAAGVDLSVATAWDTARARVRERVMVERSMPPAGNPLSEEDRRAIATWLAGPSSELPTRLPQ